MHVQDASQETGMWSLTHEAQTKAFPLYRYYCMLLTYSPIQKRSLLIAWEAKGERPRLRVCCHLRQDVVHLVAGVDIPLTEDP